MCVAYECIKEAIDKWDPIELFELHVSFDEYDMRTWSLYFINKCDELTVDCLGKIIYDVFFKIWYRN